MLIDATPAQRAPEEPLSLAMAYVPMQRLCQTFPPDHALLVGTLFPELEKPFRGRTIEGRDHR